MWLVHAALRRPITVLVLPDLHAQAADIVARLGRGEKVETFETVRVTKDGRVIEVALAISSVRGENGEGGGGHRRGV